MLTSATEPAILLRLVDVWAGYGDVPVLRGMNLQIEEGTCTAVIGANGAGKSSLLKAIFGEIKASKGQIFYRDTEITSWPIERRLRRGCGYVPQGRCSFPLMSVEENLRMGGFNLDASLLTSRLNRVYARFPFLAGKRGQLAGNMSGGEQQLLETAMALMTSPELLLIDEPSLGLSAGMRSMVFGILRSLVETEGVTVLLVEQNAMEALRIADRTVVVQQGCVAHVGTGVQMLDDPRVRAAYLGVGIGRESNGGNGG